MPGSHTGTLPGWQDGGKPAARGARLAGLPSLIGLGARPRSCRRDTWEERGGRLGPSFKARVCFPGAGGREPQKAARGPRPVSVGSGQLREAGQAWPGSGIPVGAGRGGTVPVPAVRPELPEELLLRWLNPLAGKPGTPRLSSPRGCGGIPNGWSRQPRDQAAPQNWVSADGSRPPPPPQYRGLHFHPKTRVPQHIFTSLSVLPRKSSWRGAEQLPARWGGSRQPLQPCSLPRDLDAGVLGAGLLRLRGRSPGCLAEVYHVQVGVGEVVVAGGSPVGLDAGVLRLLAHLHHPADGLPLSVEVQVRVGQVVGVGFLRETPRVPPLGGRARSPPCPPVPQPEVPR